MAKKKKSSKKNKVAKKKNKQKKIVKRKIKTRATKSKKVQSSSVKRQHKTSSKKQSKQLKLKVAKDAPQSKKLKSEVEIKEIKKLIELGKEKGFLTYEEINDILPSKLVSPEKIDDVMSMFTKMDIDVVESKSAGEKKKSEKSEKEGELDADGKIIEMDEGATDIFASSDGDEKEETDLGLGKADDPIRMYLRKMGSVSLLTREGEIVIAKRIEAGETKVLKVLLSCNVGVKEILNRGELLRQGQLRVLIFLLTIFFCLFFFFATLFFLLLFFFLAINLSP